MRYHKNNQGYSLILVITSVSILALVTVGVFLYVQDRESPELFDDNYVSFDNDYFFEKQTELNSALENNSTSTVSVDDIKSIKYIASIVADTSANNIVKNNTRIESEPQSDSEPYSNSISEETKPEVFSNQTEVDTTLTVPVEERDFEDCDNRSCIEEALSSCQPANYTTPMGELSSGMLTSYSILGRSNSGACRVELTYDEFPTAEWIGKPLVCDFKTELNLLDATHTAINSIFLNNSANCSGPLYNIYINL
jgi:hypothetical protein